MADKSNNIDITYATMGEVLDYQTSSPTSGFVESSSIFDDDGTTPTVSVEVGKQRYTYIPFGANNKLPYELIKNIGESSVMAQNKLFNVLTCYGMGFQYNDIKTKLPTQDKEVNLFKMHNNLSRFFLEQITDMKYFFFVSQPSSSTKRAIASWASGTKRRATVGSHRAKTVAPNTCSMPTGAMQSIPTTSRCCRSSTS